MKRSDQNLSNECCVKKKPTHLENVNKFYLGAYNFWQGFQIVNIDAWIDRSTQYICNNVLIYGSGRHFHSEIQHPASKKKTFFFSALKLRQDCQIVDIDVSFDRPIKYLCNEVIFDCSRSIFIVKSQPQKSIKITL